MLVPLPLRQVSGPVLIYDGAIALPTGISLELPAPLYVLVTESSLL